MASTPKPAKKVGKAKTSPSTRRLEAKKTGAEGKDKAEKQVEIYSLIDPRSNEIRYIGKANNAEIRLKAHLRETRRNTPVYCWIASLRSKGLTPLMRALERCAAKDWQQREREAIANAKAAGLKILNLADGGDQPFCSAAVRAENGRTNAINRTGTPHKKRVYQIKHKLGILLRDGFVGESARAKMRQAARKRPDLFGEWATL